MEPFTISVDESEVVDLQQRLASTRLGEPPADEPWESGVDYSFLGELIAHWREGTTGEPRKPNSIRSPSFG
ncbi:hypothetical protein BH23ACT4_BH23ACT4_04050 [soil metagenome]